MSARTDIKVDKAELERRATRLKGAEDRATEWYRQATLLDALVKLKLIRTLLPHQSTTLVELDAAIAKELKQKSPTPLP